MVGHDYSESLASFLRTGFLYFLDFAVFIDGVERESVEFLGFVSVFVLFRSGVLFFLLFLTTFERQQDFCFFSQVGGVLNYALFVTEDDIFFNRKETFHSFAKLSQIFAFLDVSDFLLEFHKHCDL